MTYIQCILYLVTIFQSHDIHTVHSIFSNSISLSISLSYSTNSYTSFCGCDLYIECTEIEMHTAIISRCMTSKLEHVSHSLWCSHGYVDELHCEIQAESSSNLKTWCPRTAISN